MGNARPEGKHLSLAKVKSSLLNEEACQKDKESRTEPQALVTEGDTNWGRAGIEVPRIRRSRGRDQSRGGADVAELKKILESKST